MQDKEYLIRSGLTFIADSSEIQVGSTKKGRPVSVHQSLNDAHDQLRRLSVEMWNTMLYNFDRFWHEDASVYRYYEKSDQLAEGHDDLIKQHRSEDELMAYLEKIQLELFVIQEVENTESLYVYHNNYENFYATYMWEVDYRLIESSYDGICYDLRDNLMSMGESFDCKMIGSFETLSTQPKELGDLVEKCEWLSYSENSSTAQSCIQVLIGDCDIYMSSDKFDIKDFIKLNSLLIKPLYEIKKVSLQELCEIQGKYVGGLIPDLS